MAKKSSSWSPFDLTWVGAEEPIQVRAKGHPPVTVIVNGCKQVLDAETRRLINFTPEEMAPVTSPSDEEKADPDYSPTAG